jgi:hypothetical protein
MKFKISKWGKGNSDWIICTDCDKTVEIATAGAIARATGRACHYLCCTTHDHKIASVSI